MGNVEKTNIVTELIAKKKKMMQNVNGISARFFHRTIEKNNLSIIQF